jgi:hypothetical protein
MTSGAPARAFPRIEPTVHAPGASALLRPGPAIPVSAVGRDPLFFFGTLMDRDVLSRVLDRPIGPDHMGEEYKTDFLGACDGWRVHP